jgi:hypothetical protein
MAWKQADFAKPASLLLRPGYLARRSTLPTAVAEKGMFRSSRYMRIMVACFVASYPFFIPPYVSILCLPLAWTTRLTLPSTSLNTVCCFDKQA